jgi:hypothetical protein
VIEPPTPPISDSTLVPLPAGMVGISRPCAARAGSSSVKIAQKRMLKPITPTRNFMNFSKLS